MWRAGFVGAVLCATHCVGATLPPDAFKPVGDGVYGCALGPLGLGSVDGTYVSGGWTRAPD